MIIKEIALSPWLCDQVLASIKKVLEENLKPMSMSIDIRRSGVCKHKDWIETINNITNPT